MNRTTAWPLDPQTLREAVDWAIATRRSVRAFLSTPVPAHEVESILETASHSASGMNMQPWRVHVVTGAAKDQLCARLAAVDDDPELAAELTEAYDYYPREWVTPYIERRR
jgi:nitroreductase